MTDQERLKREATHKVTIYMTIDKKDDVLDVLDGALENVDGYTVTEVIKLNKKKAYITDKITKKEIRDMVEGIYYSNADVLWEPFENYEKRQVKEFVKGEVQYWIKFLKNKGIEII